MKIHVSFLGASALKLRRKEFTLSSSSESMTLLDLIEELLKTIGPPLEEELSAILLDARGDIPGYMVMVNGIAIPMEAWSSHKLKEGDKVTFAPLLAAGG